MPIACPADAVGCSDVGYAFDAFSLITIGVIVVAVVVGLVVLAVRRRGRT